MISRRFRLHEYDFVWIGIAVAMTGYGCLQNAGAIYSHQILQNGHNEAIDVTQFLRSASFILFAAGLFCVIMAYRLKQSSHTIWVPGLIVLLANLLGLFMCLLS